MSAVPYKFTSAASTNLLQVRQQGSIKGFAAVNVATAGYLKIYWFIPTASVPTPVVGTTIPSLTLGLAASANVQQSWPDGITGNGQLWVAFTGAAADSDTTSGPAGSVITLLVE